MDRTAQQGSQDDFSHRRYTSLETLKHEQIEILLKAEAVAKEKHIFPSSVV